MERHECHPIGTLVPVIGIADQRDFLQELIQGAPFGVLLVELSRKGQ